MRAGHFCSCVALELWSWDCNLRFGSQKDKTKHPVIVSKL